MECYAKAIKLLSIAEQKIAPLQVAMVEVNKTVTNHTAAIAQNFDAAARNSKDVRANLGSIAALKQVASANTNSITTLKQVVSKNTNSIAKQDASIANLKATVSSLNTKLNYQIGWCDCQVVKLPVASGWHDLGCADGKFAKKHSLWNFDSKQTDLATNQARFAFLAPWSGVECCRPCLKAT